MGIHISFIFPIKRGAVWSYLELPHPNDRIVLIIFQVKSLSQSSRSTACFSIWRWIQLVNDQFQIVNHMIFCHTLVCYKNGATPKSKVKVVTFISSLFCKSSQPKMEQVNFSNKIEHCLLFCILLLSCHRDVSTSYVPRISSLYGLV